jgi:hypothetical protein
VTNDAHNDVIQVLDQWFTSLAVIEQKIVTAYLNERRYRELVALYKDEAGFPYESLKQLLGEE